MKPHEEPNDEQIVLEQTLGKATCYRPRSDVSIVPMKIPGIIHTRIRTL